MRYESLCTEHNQITILSELFYQNSTRQNNKVEWLIDDQEDFIYIKM